MTATIRRAPLGIALLLLAGSGSLASLLVHDGVGAVPNDLAQAALGETVQAKGLLVPFVAPAGPANNIRWGPVAEHFGNATYLLQDTPSDLMVLVTSEQSHTLTGGPVVVTGVGILRIQHPDQPWRTLLIIQATGWEEPILFR